MKADGELKRNGSGYYDPTAFFAMTNYRKEFETMEIYRGDLFSYEMRDRDETKIALVVSADFRSSDRYINVIILTDEPKGAVSVPITTGSGVKYADCGMVSFATQDRMNSYLRSAKKEETEMIDEGIIKCLGLDSVKPLEIIKEIPVEKIVEVKAPTTCADNVEELAAAKAEAKVYKDLYEGLLAKVMG